jgi:hypothetical protein
MEEAVKLAAQRLLTLPNNQAITLPWPIEEPPENLCGFSCPRCNGSVRWQSAIVQEIRWIDIYSCRCTSVWIPLPHEELDRCDWQGQLHKVAIAPMAKPNSAVAFNYEPPNN